MALKRELQAENDRLKTRLRELEEDEQEERYQDVRESFVAELVPEKGSADEDDIELFLDEVSSPGSSLIVDGYRYNDGPDGDGKLLYVHRWLYSDFSLQKAKDMFGGGRWNFRLKDNSGPGSARNIRSKTVQIEGAPRKNLEPLPPSKDPRGFPETVLDAQQQTLELLQELRRGPAPAMATTDPINMALSIVGAFQAVIAPMQEALLKKDHGKGPGFGDMVQIFKQGVELGKLSTPAAPDPMAAVLAGALPPLLQAINGGNGAARPDPLDVLTNPPQKEARTMSTHPQRPGWDVLLSAYVPTLIKWAGNDVDPVLRAMVVADDLPPEAELIILRQLRRGPEFFAEFLMLHPEAAPYKEWLARFWVAVADQYEWGDEEMGPYPFPGEAEPVEQLVSAEVATETKTAARPPMEIGTLRGPVDAGTD